MCSNTITVTLFKEIGIQLVIAMRLVAFLKERSKVGYFLIF